MRILIQAVILFCLVSLLPVPAAQAAPGDFVLKWGAKQHFDYPVAISHDQSGNIYVADTGPDTGIQVFNSAGERLRKFGTAGSGVGQFTFPEGVAVDRNGNIYVTELLNNRVQVFDRNGQFLRSWGTAGSGDGQFNAPSGIAIDAAGRLYVADAGNSRIQVFDSMGNFLRKWGSAGTADGNLNYPIGVAFDASGLVYVLDNSPPRITVFDGSGNFVRKWGSYGDADGEFLSPVALALDSSGRVYVTDVAADRVQVFSGTGTLLRKWGTPGEANGEFSGSWGITIAGNGEVYVVDQNNQRVQIFNGSGVFLRKWWTYGAGNGEFHSPNETAVAANGNVYVSDTLNDRIQLFTDSGAFIRSWGSLGQGDGQFDQPEGIALDAAGNVYVADKFNNRIQVFDSTGRFLRKWGLETGEQLFVPSGVAVDPAGNVYVANTGNNTVNVYDGSGKPLRQWGSLGDPNMAVPYRIALDVNGNVYVTDTGLDRIDLFDNNGNFLRQIGEGLFTSDSNLRGIAVDPSGNVFVADAGKDVIWVFNASGSLRLSWGGYGDDNGFFREPAGVSLDKAGANVYVADTDNNRIQVLQGFAGQLPAGWSTGDVGKVGIPGRAFFLNGTFTLNGSGADIWGSADGFRFVYRELTGDTQIIARVASLEKTSSFAKGGVMIRQSLAANSMHAMMDLTPGNGAEFSRRSAAGGSTTVTSRSGPVAPYWVKLVRSGNTFTGYISSDGGSWTQVGSSTIAMTASVLVGLVVSSHDNAALCTASIDAVGIAAPDALAPVVTAFSIPSSASALTVPVTTFTATDNIGVTGFLVTESSGRPSLADPGWSATAPTSFTFASSGNKTLYAWAKDAAGNISSSRSASVTVTAVLPAPWLTQDIGSVFKAGSASYLNGTFTVAGAGGDIWGTADAFRFVYKPMAGDGEIVARVASLQNTSPWAKGGVMIRQALTANSVHAMMDVTPGSGAEFSRRTATGGSTTVSSRSNITAPSWVKLVRSGSTLTGYVSANGTTWVQVGTSTVNMTGTVYAGVVVTSHAPDLCTAAFDGVK
jgi:tripartite motif-containing protein 71